MTENQPVPVPRKESETSRLLKPSSSTNTIPLVMFEVKPYSQSHTSLGDFTRDNPPVGFSLEVAPDDSQVVTQITKLSATYDEYELVLHATNQSSHTVNVEVRELKAWP